MDAEKFERFITSPKIIQLEHIKYSFYSPWKDLSNVTPIVSIEVGLTFQNAKNV
jgi:hypothetical protein